MAASTARRNSAGSFCNFFPNPSHEYPRSAYSIKVRKSFSPRGNACTGSRTTSLGASSSSSGKRKLFSGEPPRIAAREPWAILLLQPLSMNSPDRGSRPLDNRERVIFLELANSGKRWSEIARLLKRDETALRENVARQTPNLAARISKLDHTEGSQK